MLRFLTYQITEQFNGKKWNLLSDGFIISINLKHIYRSAAQQCLAAVQKQSLLHVTYRFFIEFFTLHCLYSIVTGELGYRQTIMIEKAMLDLSFLYSYLTTACILFWKELVFASVKNNKIKT